MNRIHDGHQKVKSFYFTPLNSTNKIQHRKLLSQKVSRIRNLMIHKVQSNTFDTTSSIYKSLFSYQYAIGKGGFGKV